MLNEDNYNNLMISNILRKNPNRFQLAVAVSKRARQLKDGARPLVEVPEDTSEIDIALAEIEQGHVVSEISQEEIQDVELIEEMEQFLETEVANQEKEDKEKVEKKSDKKSKKSLAA